MPKKNLDRSMNSNERRIDTNNANPEFNIPQMLTTCLRCADANAPLPTRTQPDQHDAPGQLWLDAHMDKTMH